MMKIGIFGAGYVGYSLAIFLADTEQITLFEIDKKKIESINQGKICLEDIDSFLLPKSTISNIKAVELSEKINCCYDFVVIAVPTDLDIETNQLNTKTVERIIDDISKKNITSIIIIKSTVPIGFTKQISNRYPDLSVIYMPEFIREGHTIEDNINPTRIVYGITKEVDEQKAVIFANLLYSKTHNSPEILAMTSDEAETVKLFANTYLAMRVAFFNELDSFAEKNKMNSSRIIEALGKDQRIGSLYNNPSFGFGGYCLPKDSIQLANQLDEESSNLIRCIEKSNNNRISYITKQILLLKPLCVGFYKITAKKDSLSCKNSPMLEIMNRLKGIVEICIYDPSIHEKKYDGFNTITDLSEFKRISTLIVANRVDELINDVRDKVYTRDISEW